MKTPEQKIEEAQREIEARQEWESFTAAIQVPRPAMETFTKEALMLLHLAMGNAALAQVEEVTK